MATRSSVTPAARARQIPVNRLRAPQGVALRVVTGDNELVARHLQARSDDPRYGRRQLHIDGPHGASLRPLVAALEPTRYAAEPIERWIIALAAYLPGPTRPRARTAPGR